MSQTSSLLHRLAGPSSTKAGLQKDQSEINALIAEASKGSKFYENEKRKDRELTERIGRLLVQLEHAKAGADIGKIEAAADRMLAELEAQRDLSQMIVHVDMDAFYASVEMLHNPDLAGKAFGVGSRGGVLTTASYEARKFGVRSGMAGFVAAKLCPHLIFVSNDFARYSEMSRRVMAVFRQYDPNMLVAGCDEGYLNITPYCSEYGVDPDQCVQEMREKVKEETSLTVSAGIAPNKMLAKICSDKNKPNGQFHLPFDRDSIIEFTRDLSIRKVPGIGRVNERLLESVGIKTCGDIYAHRASLALLDKTFGLRGLLRVHLGLGSTTVAPSQREERKSIGAERTFSTLAEKESVLKKLDDVAVELAKDMTESGWAGKTITLKYKLDTFQSFTRAKTFERWITGNKDELFAIGKELLMHEWPLKLRLIGLRVTKLRDLRAPETSSGIKRFLQPNAGGPSSPRKRQKVGDDTTAETQSPGAGTATTPAKVPPPFFFADSDEEEEIQELPGAPETPAPAGAPDPATASARRPEPPRFFGDSDDDGDDALPALPALPEPAGAPPDAGSASDPDLEPAPPAPSQGGADTSCPVCGRELGAVDNAALNAHVDFCLSKGAIRAAQTRAPDASQEARLPARVRVSPAAPARAGGSSIAGFFTPRPAGVKELVRGGKKGKARA